jgi:hypothetical protein
MNFLDELLFLRFARVLSPCSIYLLVCHDRNVDGTTSHRKGAQDLSGYDCCSDVEHYSLRVVGNICSTLILQTYTQDIYGSYLSSKVLVFFVGILRLQCQYC